MALGAHRQARDGSASAPARIIPLLLLLCLAPFVLSALQSERRPDQQIGQSTISSDATLLLRSYWPDYPETKAGPDDAIGGLIDAFIDSKSTGPPGAVSIADYAAARLRGSDWTVTTPEDTSRRLFALADEAERDTGDLVRKGPALLARYHARKILAGTHLALFYWSGDASALHTAISHSAAGLEIWERMVRLADAPEAAPAGIEAASLSRCKDALPFVQHDVARLQEVRQVFDRYGLFDRGLDFGPPAIQGRSLRERLRALSYNLERRFLALESGMTYSRQRGYGWFDAAGISASPAVALPDFTLRESRSSPLLLPSEALYGDFLRGGTRSTLLLDLPDGPYRVTAILANQPELAAGSFRIQAVEEDAPAGAISYAAGETGDKSMDVAVTGGKLVLEFVPEPGKDWLLNGLIVARRAPHIGHIPIFAAAPESGTAFSAAITAPDGIHSADLHLAVKGRTDTIPMLPDGTLFTARVHWLPAWGGAEAAYHITALDKAGHTGRWPAAGSVRVRIRQ